MGKTWKDKPRNVEEVPIYKRRKKSAKPKHEITETEVLKALQVLNDNELPEDWPYYKDPWNA